MLLTISGPSGSGKTTVASGLSQRLGFVHISAGEVFRELARQRDLSLEQLSKLAETDPEIDKMVDRRQVELAKSHENVVVDGRLSGRVIKGDIAVWLKAPLGVRGDRIARREGKERATALHETRTRDRSEAARYLAFFNIDTTNLDVYDLIIDTRHWDQFAVIDIVTQAVRTRREIG
ncbi:MAG: AAA family ATPase [Euryarchaeota archaeon]